MNWIKIGDILTDVSKCTQFFKNESDFTIGKGHKLYWIEADNKHRIANFIGGKEAEQDRDLAFEHLKTHLNATDI